MLPGREHQGLGQAAGKSQGQAAGVARPRPTGNLLAAYKKADDKWIPIFRAKLEIDQFPATERAKLAAGAGAIWEDWVKEQEAAGRPGREMLNFVKAESAKYSH